MPYANLAPIIKELFNLDQKIQLQHEVMKTDHDLMEQAESKLNQEIARGYPVSFTDLNDYALSKEAVESHTNTISTLEKDRQSKLDKMASLIDGLASLKFEYPISQATSNPMETITIRMLFEFDGKELTYKTNWSKAR